MFKTVFTITWFAIICINYNHGSVVVDHLPISVVESLLSKNVDSNAPKLNNNLIKLEKIINSFGSTPSTGQILCQIPEMLHLFGNCYGVVADVLNELIENWSIITNSENPSFNAIRMPANIMDSVLAALKEAEPLANKIDQELQLDQKLVNGICSAYNLNGSHGDGLLYLQNNLGGRVFNLTQEIVHSNEQVVQLITGAIKHVNNLKKQDSVPIGVLGNLTIKIIEDLMTSIANLLSHAASVIENSIADHFIVKQITGTEQTMNIDVTVHHTLIFFQKMAQDIETLIQGLDLIQTLLPGLNLI